MKNLKKHMKAVALAGLVGLGAVGFSSCSNMGFLFMHTEDNYSRLNIDRKYNSFDIRDQSNYQGETLNKNEDEELKEDICIALDFVPQRFDFIKTYSTKEIESYEVTVSKWMGGYGLNLTITDLETMEEIHIRDYKIGPDNNYGSVDLLYLNDKRKTNFDKAKYNKIMIKWLKKIKPFVSKEKSLRDKILKEQVEELR